MSRRGSRDRRTGPGSGQRIQSPTDGGDGVSKLTEDDGDILTEDDGDPLTPD